MNNKVRGGGLRLAGLICGIGATACGITAVVLSAVALRQAHLCNHCKKGAEFQ